MQKRPDLKSLGEPPKPLERAQPRKKPHLDLAVFGGFSAVKSLWRSLGAGLWVQTPAAIETELRSYQLHSLETAMQGASYHTNRFLSTPRPAGFLWLRGIQDPYGPDYTPPEETVKFAHKHNLPIVVLHFARPQQEIPDEAEINLREMLSELGLTGDEIPVFQCPAFEASSDVLSYRLSQLGHYLDEFLPIPPEKR
jgi:hypothetical protein